MFDLNQQIDGWKSAFSRRRACSSDELHELESHLREEIAALIGTGLSEEEAFAKSVSQLGDPAEICSEFAKNERRLLWDGLAIRASRVIAVLVGLSAVGLGLAVGIQKEDGLLGAHQSAILFAYVSPFLLAVLGTYAIFRTAMVKASDRLFRDRFAGQCKFLLVAIALLCAVGAVLGGLWAERQWGRFWGWDPKEIGALCVVVCALVLFFIVARHKPTSLQLGQASLMMSLVTFVAWFGPAVYMEALGATAIALLVVALIVQLSMLVISVLLPKRRLAEY